MLKVLLSSFLLFISFIGVSRILEDDFEGNSTISTWYGDDASMDINYSNPLINPSNQSSTVLRYQDAGGEYANIGFDSSSAILLDQNSTFSVKIYVPSSALTGNQTNQISLKLQNRNQSAPWSTQSEIIKPIELDQWQTVNFSFSEDNYINLNPDSPEPLTRTDFNRVVLQLNGENNTDQLTAYIDDFYFEGADSQNEPGNPNDPVYDELVWSDEFDTDGAINTNKWFHQTELPFGDSWFNGEIQHYTDRIENTFVENGNLNLVAINETFTDQEVTKEYTSARLNSKFAFTYGRVEVRAKLPTGVGTWPAIWLLGQNIQETGGYWDNQGFGTTPWPACGEIDIMEHWGDNQNYISSALHTPSSFGNTSNVGGQVIPTASTAFHNYVLDWYPDRMVFSVDGNVHYTYQPDVQNDETWPFYQDQYILLNTAIQSIIDPNFTQSTMEIDYVRIYQESSLGISEVNSELKLNIFPNPAQNQTTILSPKEALGQEVFIYNLLGQLINNFVLNSQSTSIDTSSWASGIYFLQRRGQRTTETYKVIKE
jgi:beta-glucanase (GH16 family)